MTDTVAVVGPTTWKNPEPIHIWLNQLSQQTRLVTYAERGGVSVIVRDYAHKRRMSRKSISAYNKIGEPAPVRYSNLMILDDHHPQLVLAFHPFLQNSARTADMVACAVARLTPVVLVDTDLPTTEAVGRLITQEALPPEHLAEVFAAHFGD